MTISGSLLETEEAIQEACNEVGQLATQEAIVDLDTDGSAIMTGPVKWATKGKTRQSYQTPYGKVVVKRHLYQGGQTWCPLEDSACIIRHATPRFAKQLAHKYALSNAFTAHDIDSQF